MQRVFSPKINEPCLWSETSHPGERWLPQETALLFLLSWGQNLALNIAEKDLPISVYNWTTSKVDETIERAKLERTFQFMGFMILHHLSTQFRSPMSSSCL
ncbi:unnamed protein product [Musa acuminata subsp. burmannicoides]